MLWWSAVASSAGCVACYGTSTPWTLGFRGLGGLVVGCCPLAQAVLLCCVTQSLLPVVLTSCMLFALARRQPLPTTDLLVLKVPTTMGSNQTDAALVGRPCDSHSRCQQLAAGIRSSLFCDPSRGSTCRCFYAWAMGGRECDVFSVQSAWHFGGLGVALIVWVWVLVLGLRVSTHLRQASCHQSHRSIHLAVLSIILGAALLAAEPVAFFAWSATTHNSMGYEGISTAMNQLRSCGSGLIILAFLLVIMLWISVGAGTYQGVSFRATLRRVSSVLLPYSVLYTVGLLGLSLAPAVSPSFGELAVYLALALILISVAIVGVLCFVGQRKLVPLLELVGTVERSNSRPNQSKGDRPAARDSIPVWRVVGATSSTAEGAEEGAASNAPRSSPASSGAMPASGVSEAAVCVEEPGSPSFARRSPTNVPASPSLRLSRAIRAKALAVKLSWRLVRSLSPSRRKKERVLLEHIQRSSRGICVAACGIVVCGILFVFFRWLRMAPLQITCATLLYLFAWRGCDVAIAYLEYTLKSGSCKSEADFQERSSSIAERSSVVKRRTGTSGTDRTADRYRSSSNSQMRT